MLVFMIIVFENYDKEIAKQKKEIKILKADKDFLMKQIINLENKDCSLLEHYYYNHNGVIETEEGYIIDGAYYEYKRELTPEEQFGEE
jgi:cell division protein FtsB